MQRTKVLQIITWLRPGGIEKWLLKVLERLDYEKYEMDFCCKGSDLGDPIMVNTARQCGARLVHCPLSLATWEFVATLGKVLSKGKYDVVHNHLETHSGLVVRACRETGVPVISSFHNTHFRGQTWTATPGLQWLYGLYAGRNVRYTINKSDVVTGCSKAVVDVLKLQGCHSEKLRVLRYGIDDAPALSDDMRQSAREAVRHELGISKTAPVLLHVGRFCEQKNHQAVLQVEELVRRARPDTVLLLVGAKAGPMYRRVEELVQRKRLVDAVRFLGVRYDVYKLMTAADVFVFPSLYEGFGLAALEAAAVGLPVVGSRVPGLCEAVCDGVTGFLHDPWDIEGMASSVLRLLQEERCARDMRRAGPHYVKKWFSLETSVKETQRLYDECVGVR